MSADIRAFIQIIVKDINRVDFILRILQSSHLLCVHSFRWDSLLCLNMQNEKMSNEKQRRIVSEHIHEEKEREREGLVIRK